MTTATPVHASRSHALCSASGAERWLACPGSVALAEQMPKVEGKASVYALEGTKAHELAETLLLPFVASYNKHGNHQAPEGMPLGGLIRVVDFPAGAVVHDYPEDMKAHIEEYAQLIWDDIVRHGPKKVFIEEKVCLDKELEMFGTVDCFFAYKKGKKAVLNVYDLKYGKGKVVEAKSFQLFYYALAIQASYPKVEFDEYHLHIFQPRAEHDEGTTRTYVLSKNEAGKVRERILSGARRALSIVGRVSGGGSIEDEELSAGDHCGFCAARAVCKAYAAHLNEKAGIDFTDEPALLVPAVKEQRSQIRSFVSDEQAAGLLRHKAEIIKFLDALTEYGINRFQEGDPISGTKVVAGRSNRKWAESADTVVKGLAALGIKEPYDKKIRNLGSVERELVQLGHKKKDTAELLSKLTVKTRPSLTLTTEDDPRPAITNATVAAGDFTELDASGEEVIG